MNIKVKMEKKLILLYRNTKKDNKNDHIILILIDVIILLFLCILNIQKRFKRT